MKIEYKTLEEIDGETKDLVEGLHRAVIEDFEKKAKLGQYVIIQRNGEMVRIPAAQALEEYYAEEARHSHGTSAVAEEESPTPASLVD